jgi:hypothetical protein
MNNQTTIVTSPKFGRCEMEDKTETVIDDTYLRPGIVTRAGAIGLAAMGIGAGLLLACYGASFFFDTNSKRLDALTAKVEKIALRPDRTNELIAKLDDLRHEAGKIDARIAAHLASIEGSLNELNHRPIISDNPDHRGKTINANVITSEVTVFHTVPHDNGSIYTGWRYPDGASADQPPIRQYCYWDSGTVGGALSGASVRINLANNGVRLPNITDGVPLLEDALKKCVWWNGSTN